MAYVIARNNVFNYGEVGERLSGLRESEIYQQSAKKIENFIINEMGNLKIAKQWQETKLQETESFVALFDTKYPFYVGVGRNYIYTFQKNLEKTLYKSPINGEFKNYKMIENRLFLIGNTTEVYEFDKKDGNIGKSNFMDLIRFPVKDKEQIKIDVYKTYKVGEEIRVSLLGTYTDPKLKSNDGIYLFETEIKLERLYKQYKTSVTKDDIFDVKDGLVFGVLHGFFQKNGQKQYLIGNIPIEFTGETQDKVYGSSYFSGISKNISGEISFGELKELKENLTDIGIFEDRMYVIQDGIFYFSKKGGVPSPWHHGKNKVFPFRSLHHFDAFVFTGRNRLFDQDVVAAFNCLHCRFIMQVVCGCVHNRIRKFGLLKHFFPAMVQACFRNPIAVRHLVKPFCVWVGQACNLYSVFGKIFCIYIAASACA